MNKLCIFFIILALFFVFPFSIFAASNNGLQFNPISSAFDTLEGIDFGNAIPGLGSNFTVEAYVYYTGGTSSYDVVLGRQNWGQEDWILAIDGGFPFGSITYDGDHNNTNGKRKDLISPTAISANSWHHLALVGTGSEFRLYVDGIQKTATAQIGPIFHSGTAVNVFMGRKQNTSQSAVYHGMIDEARISNSTRYFSNFSNPTTPFTTDSNTVALWHLDEGSGNVANDSSGHNYKGTIQQTSRWVNGFPFIISPSPSSISGPINPSPTPLKPGDIDGNGKVDIFDYNTLLTNFGKSGTSIQGDLNGSGKVDIFDYNILLTNFGNG